MGAFSYLRRRLVLGVAFLSLLSRVTTTQAKDVGNCPPKPLASIDLTVNGPVLVPVTLQGQPAWMILQTEASVTLIYSNAAAALHLTTRNIEKDYFELSLGGRRVTQLASFRPLAIGDLAVARTEFMVDPFPHDAQIYAGRMIAGSLAMDLLWPYDVELDLAHRKLVLYSANTCGGRAVSWADHYGRMPMNFTAIGNIYFTAEIDGQKLETSIATSSEGSAMSLDVARRLSSPEQTSVAPVDAAASSVSAESLTRVIKLASGDLVIPEAIHLISAPDSCVLSTSGNPDGALGYSGCYGRYPLVLGRDALRKLHLYFASKEKLIYFTPADVQ